MSSMSFVSFVFYLFPLGVLWMFAWMLLRRPVFLTSNLTFRFLFLFRMPTFEAGVLRLPSLVLAWMFYRRRQASSLRAELFWTRVSASSFLGIVKQADVTGFAVKLTLTLKAKSRGAVFYLLLRVSLAVYWYKFSVRTHCWAFVVICTLQRWAILIVHLVSSFCLGDISAISTFDDKLNCLHDDVFGSLVLGDQDSHHQRWLRFSANVSTEGLCLYEACVTNVFLQKVCEPKRGDYLFDL